MYNMSFGFVFQNICNSDSDCSRCGARPGECETDIDIKLYNGRTVHFCKDGSTTTTTIVSSGLVLPRGKLR